MVYPNSNIVEMGIGDVGITFTAQGTMSAPIGSIIFYNQKKQKITTLPDDYQIDKDSTETYLSHPDQEICLAFSSAESINAVISILQAMKKNIFEDETTREYAIQRNMELEGR